MSTAHQAERSLAGRESEFDAEDTEALQTIRQAPAPNQLLKAAYDRSYQSENRKVERTRPSGSAVEFCDLMICRLRLSAASGISA